MNVIKEITKGDIKLTHSWFIDYTGLKRNAFDIFHIPTRTHYPFLGWPRVTNTEKGTASLDDDTSPFTDKDYDEMMNEQVGRLTPPHAKE